ncbi:uncharacterized protein [Nicotiana tomentosiformis]|uniref:uncharacterized protein n=1 Tax=Nicotiana tomentosiformis TaxID=4098 RepID=UPI00388C5E54
MWGSEEDKALAGLRNLFLEDEDMDCSVIVEKEEEEVLIIQTVEKGVVLRNWTATPSRARRVPGITISYRDEPTTVTYNETTQHKDSDSKEIEEEDIIPKEIVREVEDFENKPKSNLDETEIVNLGDSEIVKETRISIHLSPSEKEEYTCFLKEYEDIFTWSYDDMTGKLGFIVSRRGIELDPSKVKAIQDLPPPKNKKDMMSFLGRLNCISHFIAQSTVICELIFKMLKKDAATSSTEDYHKAFDRIKEYLSTPPVLVPPEPGRPLLCFGCVLGQHDEMGRKEQAIYYLSKKMDPLKYIFQKPMPTRKLAKWQLLLSEFDIVYATQKAVKGQALTDHLAENPVQGEWATKNTKILPYLYHLQEMMKRFTKIEFRHIPRIQNEFADALATFSSMIQHPDKNFIDPIPVKIHNQPAYCTHVKEEADGNPWFHDIKEYLAK